MSVELTNNAHLTTNKNAVTVFKPSADESETYHDNDDDDANHKNEELNGLLEDEISNNDAELIKRETAQTQTRRFQFITFFVALIIGIIIGGVITATLGISGIEKRIASSAVRTDTPIENPPTNEVQVENYTKQVQVANYINGSALMCVLFLFSSVSVSFSSCDFFLDALYLFRLHFFLHTVFVCVHQYISIYTPQSQYSHHTSCRDIHLRYDEKARSFTTICMHGTREKGKP